MAVNEDIFMAYHAALDSPQPLVGMRELVQRELEDRVPREVVLSQLEELRARLRMDGMDAQEDAVLEVMDFVTGWCSPHMRL